MHFLFGTLLLFHYRFLHSAVEKKLEMQRSDAQILKETNYFPERVSVFNYLRRMLTNVSFLSKGSDNNYLEDVEAQRGGFRFDLSDFNEA